jgi:two-component system NarL family response regulator
MLPERESVGRSGMTGESTANLRILLVDDHRLFREALMSLLERIPGYAVVAETGDGADVVRLAQECVPDLVCIDVGMPRMNGIDATRALKAAFPQVKVVALSSHTDHRNVIDALEAGALAYVSKAEASEELLRAISAVQRDSLYLSPAVAGALTQAAAAPADRPRTNIALGRRECEVLTLVANGLSSVEISRQLQIAPSTVEAHRRNVMRKLDLHSVADLTRYAVRAGLVPL